VDENGRARILREARELYDSGRSAQATQLFATVRDAFSIAERWGAEYGDFSNNYASALAESGDLQAAEVWFLEAERVYREHGAWDALANTWFNLGNVAKYRHDRQTADRQYRMSLNLFRELGDQPRVVTVTLSMAALILDEGDVETVQLLLRQADDLIEQGHGGPNASWSRSFILGRIALTNGDPASATAHLRAALQVAEQHLGPDYVTETVSMISSMAMEAPGAQSQPSPDELAELERRFREVPSRALTAHLFQLATAWEQRGNFEQADRLYRECLDTVGLARAAAYSADKNALMVSLAIISHRYSESLLRRGEAGPALAAAEYGQGRSLLDRMFRHQVRHQEGRTIRAVGDSRVYLEPPSLNDITAASRNLSLHVLKFLQTQDTVVGWFVTADGTVEGWESPAAAGPLAACLEAVSRPRLRNDLRAAFVTVDPVESVLPGWDEIEMLLARVYETLLPASIRSRLETDTGRLLVIPHAAYYHLPWGFLGSAGGRIGDRWEVALAPSLGVFLQLDHRRDPGRATSSPIAVLAASNEWTLDLSGEGRHIVHFPELYGTLTEAHLVAGLLGTTPEATGSSVRDLLTAIEAADVVHIAAHGYWHPELGGESFLLLDEDTDEDRRKFKTHSAQDTSDPPDDHRTDQAGDTEPHDGSHPGLLSAERIAGCNSPARLVVLSGCQTGLADSRPDSYLSLPHSFLIAGAKAVLMTLWPIGDAGTIDFFRAFYGRLAAGDCPAAALAQAQRDLRGLLDGWDVAAFVLLGNPFAPVGAPPMSGPTFCGGDVGWQADAREVLDLNKLGGLTQGDDDIFNIGADYRIVRSSKHAAYRKYETDRAIATVRAALNRTAPDSPEYPELMFRFGMAYGSRYDITDDIEDLDREVDWLGRAADAWRGDLDSERASIFAGALLKLGITNPEPARLELIVTRLRMLLTVTDVDRGLLVAALGAVLSIRYDVLHRVEDLNEAIAALEQSANSGRPTQGALLLLPGALTRRALRSGDTAEATRALELARQMSADIEIVEALRVRYLLTGHPPDLDDAIAHAERLRATDPADARAPGILCNLYRARAATKPDADADLGAAVAAGRAAVELTAPGDWQLKDRRHNLGAALAASAHASDTFGDLDEAIRLMIAAQVEQAAAGEFISAASRHDLGAALWVRHHRSGHAADLDAAIAELHSAAQSTGTGSQARLTPRLLSQMLLQRHEYSQFNDDLEDAVRISRQLVSITPADANDLPDSYTELGNALLRRYNRTGQLDDLDAAVSAARSAAELPGSERVAVLSNLGNVLRRRYQATRRPADIQEALSLLHRAIDLARLTGRVSSTVVANLGRAYRARSEVSDDQADVDRGVEYLRQAVDEAPPQDPNRNFHLLHLADLLRRRYDAIGRIDDAVDAEEAYQSLADQAVSGHVVRSHAYIGSASLAARRHDWDSSAVRYRSAVTALHATAGHRASRLDKEHHLRSLSTVGADAAAAALHTGQISGAITVLEQARGIILGQQLDLQTDLTELGIRAPELAERLNYVRLELASLADPDMPKVQPYPPPTSSGLS
jgi:CHAT domain-containing protein/tetratricopeptide (TPR) repeat protein